MTDYKTLSSFWTIVSMHTA